MRIALISPVFPPGGQSGIGAAVLHHALGLSRLGHEVHVYTWLDQLPQPSCSFSGITVHRLSNPVWVNRLQSLANKLLRWGNFLLKGGPRQSFSGTVRNLRGMITLRLLALSGALEPFDIVEAPEWGGACAVFSSSRVPGVKVTKLHGSFYSHYHKFQPYTALFQRDVQLASWIERRGIRHSNLVLSPSQAMAEDAHQWLGVLEPIQVLPNSIDLPYIDSHLNKSRALGLSDGAIHVTFAGRITNQKGAHVMDGIIRKLRGNPDSGRWRFTLAGYCRDVRQYPAFYSSNTRNVVVKLLGKLSTPQLLDVLNQTDIFLFPSHSENCPMTLLEAMACGLPVIASAVGGITEIVNQGTEGILCPRDDVQAFTQALLDLKDTDRRKCMGAKARARIERDFASEVIAQEWLELCQRAGLRRESTR